MESEQPQQPQQKRPPTTAEIVKGYNDTKQKYSIFFQKALDGKQTFS